MLLLLTVVLARRNGLAASRRPIVAHVRTCRAWSSSVLALDDAISTWPKRSRTNITPVPGPWRTVPVAMEGALKLKEISYIHAEAYPAGELKHGPLALVDGEMPVVTVAPNNELLEKLKSNLQEVRARGGELFVFADRMPG